MARSSHSSPAIMLSVAYADTHTGPRSNNEDWYQLDPELGLFIIADGMGGYRGGELASRLAVDTLEGFYRHPPADAPDRGTGCAMGEAFRIANAEVRKQRRGHYSKMGSTLSVLVVKDGRATIGHIGDSRVYRLRQGKLDRLTTDHSLVAALQAAGVSSEVLHHKFGHVITRAIGVAESPFPDVIYEEVELGDRFLLCTDGLTDVVDDESISRILEELPPSEATTALIEEALRRGTEDNVTALVVEVRQQPTDHENDLPTRELDSLSLALDSSL